MSNDLISRKAMMEGRVENDPVRIAAMCVETAYDVDYVCEEIKEIGRNFCISIYNNGTYGCILNNCSNCGQRLEEED